MSRIRRGCTRRYERIQTRLEVDYGIEGWERHAATDNVSEGGLYLNTNQIYTVRTPLVLHIQFPQRTICHRGEVVWAIDVPRHLTGRLMCGMGIRFLDPLPEWHAFFEEWKRGFILGQGDHE